MSDSHAAPLTVSGSGLTISDLAEVAAGRPVRLDEAAIRRMRSSHRAVLRAMEGDQVVYGVNTGFGPLRDQRIPTDRLVDLQQNLIRSHAAGVGPPFSASETRAAMLLLANCLCRGCSGIDPKIVKLLLDFLNNFIHPVVPSQGSLGASGDLAPLAHVALCLIGEGEVEYRGKRMSAATALRAAGLGPAGLHPKAGLSLINGTHVLTGVGALALAELRELLVVADIAAALHVEASLSSKRPFSKKVVGLRPHPGALEVASNVTVLVEGSGLIASHADCGEVQDAYSIRCAPQVHGAIRDAWGHAASVVEREMNSVTDNPVYVGKEFISAGNFHGEPCALVFDYTALGVVELGNISERRTERLLNPALSRGLPPFLASEPGLQSGLMLAHYTAAALASENKTMAFPASADSVPTGANQEDHVSMGAISARRLASAVNNLSKILAVELLVSARAVRIRERQRGVEPAAGTRAALEAIERIAPYIQDDVSPSPWIEGLARSAVSGEIKKHVLKEVGELL